MAEVTFYLLASESQQARQIFACKLIEKIYRQGYFSYILTDSVQQSQQMDNQLWTFRAGSFVPHQIYRHEVPQFKQTILIGNETVPEHWRQVVLNLSSQQNLFQEKYDRILEILDSSEKTRQIGRGRYRHYKQAGYEITTHDVP